MNKAAKFLFAAVLSLASTGASAALIQTAPSCSNGGALAAMKPNAIACAGAFEGNDSNQQADVLSTLDSAFGVTVGAGTWSFSEKIDNTAGTAGTVTFSSPLKGYFSVALKASNQFSLYLFDTATAAVTSIDYATIGTSLNKKGHPQDLSHASLYRFAPDDTNNPSSVPVPPALALFGGALALTALLPRLRRSQQPKA